MDSTGRSKGQLRRTLIEPAVGSSAAVSVAEVEAAVAVAAAAAEVVAAAGVAVAAVDRPDDAGTGDEESNDGREDASTIRRERRYDRDIVEDRRPDDDGPSLEDVRGYNRCTNIAVHRPSRLPQPPPRPRRRVVAPVASVRVAGSAEVTFAAARTAAVADTRREDCNKKPCRCC